MSRPLSRHAFRPLLHSIVSTALAALATAAAAAGQVEVRFNEPARFSDAGQGELETGRTVDVLTRHLQGYANRLRDGQTLRVEVLDVDLAGSMVTGSRRNTRVLLGLADAPSIQLRYALIAGDRTLKQGEERLTDLDYLRPSLVRQVSGDFGHELRLLDDWFEERFAAP